MQFYFSILVEIPNYSSMLFNDTNSKYCCKYVFMVNICLYDLEVFILFYFSSFHIYFISSNKNVLLVNIFSCH